MGKCEANGWVLLFPETANILSVSVYIMFRADTSVIPISSLYKIKAMIFIDVEELTKS